MNKKFLFSKILAIFAIVILLISFTTSSAYAAFTFSSITYNNDTAYRLYLNDMNSFTNGINSRTDYNTARKQMINKILELRDKYNNKPGINNISNKLLTAVLTEDTGNTSNLLQKILDLIKSLFSNIGTNLKTLTPDAVVNTQATTAGKLVGNDYNVKLSANIYYANKDANGNPTSNKWVVLVHAFMMNGQAIADTLGQMYLDQGFNVIAPDLRGCGNSEGKSTMGYLESLDIYDWLTYLNNTYPNNCNEIVVHGVSLGGATTLFLSGLEVDGVSIKDKKVIGVIEDCGYTSMTGIINDLFGSLGDSELVATVLGLLDKVDLGNLGNILSSDNLVENLLINTIDVGLTTENFDEKQNALNSLANAEVPILIIHGTADTTVPFENSDRVYETAMNNTKIPYVQRFVAEGENHAFIIMGNKYNVYEGHVQNFITKAEEIKAGNTVDKDSDYEQEEEQGNSIFNSLFRLLTLFKNMLK